MKVIVEKDYKMLSKKAAEILKEEIENNPSIVLGLATGSTPVETYNELIRYHKEEGLDFSKVKTFNLDEYVGLDGDHPNSYRYFMNENLFNHINIDLDNTFVPDGKALDTIKYCKDYDQFIDQAGGIDIQILGIGTNGHIAFNEPDDSLSVNTSIVDLTQSTIESNARFFDSMDEVPKTAITMGIGSILKAKKIILLASGSSKAEIVKALIEGDRISTQLPASLLLLHPDVTIIVDEDVYKQ